MEKKRQEGASPPSSSINFDHLFGPKDSSSSSSSSSSSGVFGSIFSPPTTVQGRGSSHSTGSIIGSLRKPGESSKGAERNIFNSKDKSSLYQNESAEPCYFSSSIYYGGQENYSPRTKATTESHHHAVFKKDGGEDDPNGSNSNSASRGNWWQGSLYY